VKRQDFDFGALARNQNVLLRIQVIVDLHAQNRNPQVLPILTQESPSVAYPNAGILKCLIYTLLGKHRED
jgi:hypothetical protein